MNNTNGNIVFKLARKIAECDLEVSVARDAESKESLWQIIVGERNWKRTFAVQEIDDDDEDATLALLYENGSIEKIVTVGELVNAGRSGITNEYKPKARATAA